LAVNEFINIKTKLILIYVVNLNKLTDGMHASLWRLNQKKNGVRV